MLVDNLINESINQLDSNVNDNIFNDQDIKPPSAKDSVKEHEEVQNDFQEEANASPGPRSRRASESQNFDLPGS